MLGHPAVGSPAACPHAYRRLQERADVPPSARVGTVPDQGYRRARGLRLHQRATDLECQIGESPDGELDGTIEAVLIVRCFRSDRTNDQDITTTSIKCSPRRASSSRSQFSKLGSFHLRGVREGEFGADRLELGERRQHGRMFLD